MNNQVINIINKSSVNKLQLYTKNKKNESQAMKLFNKFNSAVKQMEKSYIFF